MEKYRKLLVALVGAVALFVPEAAGLEGDVATVYDGVVGILTAFGVFRVPNAVDAEALQRGDVEIQ